MSSAEKEENRKETNDVKNGVGGALVRLVCSKVKKKK